MIGEQYAASRFPHACMGQGPYDYVLKSSYGNDSIALMTWLYERQQAGQDQGAVLVMFNDTGWAVDGWIEQRVDPGEQWAWTRGFDTVRVPSIGMAGLVLQYGSWPTPVQRWCTGWLKEKPSRAFLDIVDPNAESLICVGIRREESAKRAQWPEYQDNAPGHGGRDLWSPLVRWSTEQRDTQLQRHGFEVYPGRSDECSPCVMGKREMLRRLPPSSAQRVRELERRVGLPMYRPRRVGGEADIDGALRWAQSAPRSHRAGQTSMFGEGCEGSWCGI